jgi:hypothetical protein
MTIKSSFIVALLMLLTVSSLTEGKDKNKKKQPDRGMLESMQAVPCGAKDRGLAGLGSVFASVGVQHVNSHEQLCPQYLFRTDEMEYHIRPLDLKHAAILPVGHEGEFKIKKDRLFLKVPDGENKTRPYQVVSMQPSNSESKPSSSAVRPPDRAPANGDPTNNNEEDKTTGEASNPPPRL